MIVANVWKVRRIDFVVKMNVVSMSSVEDALTEMAGNKFEILSKKWGDKVNKSTLEKENRLSKTIKALDDLNFVLCATYPQFSCSGLNVNSASFDEKTLGELKETIKNFIDKRQRELLEEFKML